MLQAVVRKVGPEKLLRMLDADMRAMLPYVWELNARSKQLAPRHRKWRWWLIQSGRGFGKALALTTPIPTPTGWTTMGALAEGDEVYDEAGRVCRVTFATPVQMNRKCFLVVFDDGSSIVADADHRWLTTTKLDRKRGRSGSVKTTEEIRATLRYCEREVNHAIPVTGALTAPEVSLPIDPYVLGVWLGDGDSRAAFVTSGDLEQFELLRAAGERVGTPKKDPKSNAFRAYVGREEPQRNAKTGRMIANGSLHSRLRSLGVHGTKRIPTSYLRASVEQRRALLQGLMDTDGSVVPNSNHLEFTVMNEGLALDFMELAVSLGMKPRMLQDRATLNGMDMGPRFRVTLSTRQTVFRLSRKLAAHRRGGGHESRTRNRFVVEVRPVDSVPVRCIQVDSPSHLFLAGRSMIPTHNTRSGSEWVKQKAKRMPGSIGALVGQTPGEVRKIQVEGPAGILACTPPDQRPEWRPAIGLLTWPLVKGSPTTAHVYSGANPGEFRGPQHHWAWIDEWAKFARARETYENLNFGLRLQYHAATDPHDKSPQCCITTTPRPIQVLRELVAKSSCVVTYGSTFENEANLDESFLDEMRPLLGTTIGEQELKGLLLSTVPGALWQRAWFDRPGFRQKVDLKQFDHIVVAIDPAVSDTERSDETGIIAAGMWWTKGQARRYHTIADRSIHGSPRDRMRAAIHLMMETEANEFVVETNNGGDWIPAAIEAEWQLMQLESPELARRLAGRPKIVTVTATRGKHVRAEPISTLYEQPGTWSHEPGLEVLEDQLVTWSPLLNEKSPDRLDAQVWAGTRLSTMKRVTVY